MAILNRREVMRQMSGVIAGSMSLGIASARDRTSVSRPRIKIGQIGVGHSHAAGTLLAYRKSVDFEVVGIVEPDDELRRQAMSQPAYQDLRWMTQDQLLNIPDLQGVLVETRVSNLLDAAEACINAGKHIHLDKPAGDSLPQFKRILNSAARQKLLVQMGYVYRHNPAVVLLRDFLKQGWLGEVFEIHAVMSKTVTPDVRKRLAQYRGGILFELGGHVIDLIVGIMGRPEKVTPFIQHISSQDDTLADNALAVLTYPRAIVTAKSSAVEVEGNKRRHFVVCGTEGTFHIQPLDNPSVRLSLSQARGRYEAGIQEVELPKSTRYINEAAEMARIIRGEQSPEFSYDHDLAVQTTLLEACGLPLDA